MQTNFRKTVIMKKLQKGDKIALIAPSAQIGEIEKIQKGLDFLKSLGFEPVFAPHLYDVRRYMAGTDEKRAEDVNWAFADKEIKAVFCVRAAAGAARILPYIDYELIKNNPKPLVGFCDNAALMLALNKKSDIISWNGFLPTYDFRGDSLDSLVHDSLLGLISGQPYKIISGTTLRSGKAEGTFLCSNLSVLMKLAGTPYFPDLTNKILLVEDIHERLHKIDLMLQQLKQQPNFDKLKGIIFGHFTDCSGDEEDGDLDDCFADFLYKTSFPCIKDFEFGHTVSRYVLPLGANVKFSADETKLEICSY